MEAENTQRGLIDFLWEWAESKGQWAQLLVQSICANNQLLTGAERERVFSYYLQEIGFVYNPPLSTLATSKPTFSPTNKTIQLTKLSEITGVNKLAEGQELNFSPNITVIYGNNGAGKTGYSRVLKSQGSSYDPDTTILHNVHQDEIPKSAKIEFTVDGEAQELIWDGATVNENLSNISVFNSNCVHVSLNSGRELLVSPQGFHLFQLVMTELSNLSSLHTSEKAAHTIELPWSINLKENTPQKNLIDKLSQERNTEILYQLSIFTEEDNQKLENETKELKGLNKAALSGDSRKLALQLSELTTIIANIKHTQSNLTKPIWELIKVYNGKLKTLKEKTQLGLSAVAEENGVALYKTEEFKNFLQSADAYIKAINKDGYPNNADDNCVYCGQAFADEKSRNLVDAYQKILNDTTQAEISNLEEKRQKIIDTVNLVIDTFVFNHPTFGIDDDTLDINQPEEILVFNKALQAHKKLVVGNTIGEAEFEVDYSTILNFLETKETAVKTEKTKIDAKLANLDAAEKKLQASINELTDRKLLSNNRESINVVINSYNARNLLDRNSNAFNSNTLSRKTTEAREALVAQDFQANFNAELLKFRKQHLGVQLSFQSQAGKSRLNQGVANHTVESILSEGEQKTIALCEFLTELEMNGTSAPVVFDDPVNSLDHLIIQDVARRLVELSRNYQVIVFTHNVIFYNAFFSLQKNPTFVGIDFKYYDVKSNSYNAGILSDGAPINKLKTYTSKLNLICNNGIGDRDEGDVAAEGYAYLRTSLELLVSNHIFQEIVGRYRPNIMMTKFPAIKGDMIEQHKAEIDALFGRASGYIRAHSHPEEQHAPPTLNDLKSDFARFKIIEADFKV